MSGLILYANNTEFMISYNNFDTLQALVPMIELAVRYAKKYHTWEQGALHLSEDAFRAQFAVSFGITNQSFAADSFSFCGFNCTIFSVVASDIFNQGISNYFYQLVNGSCQNTISFDSWYDTFFCSSSSSSSSHRTCHSLID